MAKEYDPNDPYQQLRSELGQLLDIGRDKLLRKLASLNMKQRMEVTKRVRLKNSINAWAMYWRSGEIRKLGFSFEKQGIYIEHGVGRGRPVGSPKANSLKKPWLEPTLEPFIDDIADLISNGYLDIIEGELRVLIPGIIDKTV